MSGLFCAKLLGVLLNVMFRLHTVIEEHFAFSSNPKLVIIQVLLGEKNHCLMCVFNQNGPGFLLHSQS